MTTTNELPTRRIDARDAQPGDVIFSYCNDARGENPDLVVERVEFIPGGKHGTTVIYWTNGDRDFFPNFYGIYRVG